MPFIIRILDPTFENLQTVYENSRFFARWSDAESGLYTTVDDRQQAFLFTYKPDAEDCRDKLAISSSYLFLVEALHGKGSAEIPKRIQDMLERRCRIARELDRINCDLNEWLVLNHLTDHRCGALMGDNTVYSDPYGALRDSRSAITSMMIDRLIKSL